MKLIRPWLCSKSRTSSSEGTLHRGYCQLSQLTTTGDVLTVAEKCIGRGARGPQTWLSCSPFDHIGALTATCCTTAFVFGIALSSSRLLTRVPLEFNLTHIAISPKLRRHCAESRKLKYLIDLRPAGEVPRPRFAFLCQASNESRIVRLRDVRVLACWVCPAQVFPACWHRTLYPGRTKKEIICRSYGAHLIEPF